MSSAGAPMADSTAVRGRIFNIQRFSIHDGPGIRTTVFLKGCPLRCMWCHNPASQSPREQLAFSAERCVGCGRCAEACPRGAHSIRAGRHKLDRSACRACGACAERCPSRALELVGRDASAEEVLAEVERDREFYDDSGGGMTLSGGEPAAQPEFALALLRGARARGISTAVETCGWCGSGIFEEMLPVTDLFLFDLKAGPSRHRELTGVPLEPVAERLRRLGLAGVRLRLRLPLVPGLNDTDEHFASVAAMAAGIARLEGVEVLPFHEMGRGEYARLGMACPVGPEVRAPSEEAVSAWIERLAALGVRAARA